MQLTQYANASDFLAAVRPPLEAQEAANNLMYGLALRLEAHPERIQIPPFYAAVHGPGGLAAAALMTPPHNLIVFSTRPEEERASFDQVARHLLSGGWSAPGVVGPNAPALSFAQAWSALTGQTATLGMHERIYQLRAVIPPPQPGGALRPALEGDLELAARWLHDFEAEALPMQKHSLEAARETARQKIDDWDLYLWEDGEPVAMAGRVRPTPHGWCVGPVYTPPERRGRGYASALTADLSQLLLDTGKQFVSLFTNLANPVSNSIYQKIGYRPLCDFDLYRFGEEQAR
jgi:predicted GNAT family acetyltransferase